MNTLNNNSKSTKPPITNSEENAYNPYTPENLYKDFDMDQDPQFDEAINQDTYQDPYFNSEKPQIIEKKKNFVYESFADRIKKIKVKLSSNFQNDMSFLKIETKQGFKIKSNETESNFLTILTREKVMNTSGEFKDFVNELNSYTKSYLIFINNSDTILKIFSEKIKGQIQEEQKNFPFIISILEVLTGLIKDLRDESYDIFLDNIFPHLIQFLTQTQNVEVIEKTFGVLVNIFKFLQNAILSPRNFNNFFYIFSELIFNKRKYIRKFSCESISYLIKNLEEDKLGDIMRIILNPFINPERFFDLESSKKSEKKNLQENSQEKKCEEKNSKINFNEIFLEKILNFENSTKIENNNNKNRLFISFIHEALLNFEYENNSQNSTQGKGKEFLEVHDNLVVYNQKIKLKIFLLECLSDFILEILIGVNKDISIKADLFLEKIKIKNKSSKKYSKNSDLLANEKEEIKNYEYLSFIIDLSVIIALVKLYSKLKYEKKTTVVALLNFYLIKKINKEIKFSKLKNEKISNQFSNFFSEQISENDTNPAIPMDIELQGNEIFPVPENNQIKSTIAKAKTFILYNLFIIELFNKNHLTFDAEIKRYLFDFLKLALKKNEQKNFFYEIKNKNYFYNITKIDLITLLIKFYPTEFTEYFKLNELSYNWFNKSLYVDVNNEKQEYADLFSLIDIFSNQKDSSEKNNLNFSFTINEIFLNLFLEKLKNLQKFYFFKTYSILDNRTFFLVNKNISSQEKKNEEIQDITEQQPNEEMKSNKILQQENLDSNNPYYDNEDYNLDYDSDLINKFFSFILNFFDFQNVKNILNIKTTYDLILIKNSKNETNKNYFTSNKNSSDKELNFYSANNNNFSNIPFLLLANDFNFTTIFNFLKNFSIVNPKDLQNTNNSHVYLNDYKNTENITIKIYLEIYSFLIMGDLVIRSISSLKSANRNKIPVFFQDVINKQNEIFLDYIKKSIETILIIFEKNKFSYLQDNTTDKSRGILAIDDYEEITANNFASEILKLPNIEDQMLFSILFRDFNNINTFYIEKNSSFINLLDLFTENYLKIILNPEFLKEKNQENKFFIIRILKILFLNSYNGSSFKTINTIIKFYFNENFEKFQNFCTENNIFFLKSPEALKSNIFPSQNNSKYNKKLEEFIFSYSYILYSNNNSIKLEFVNFTKNWLKKESNFSIKGLDEIFDLLNWILNLEFDILNDKKYSLNFEILTSKMELIPLDNQNDKALFIFVFIFDFLIGSYWIRLTKTLWPVLTKCIERFFMQISEIKNEKLLFLLGKKIFKLFEFIHNVGSMENLLAVIDEKKFEKFYFIFSEKFEEKKNLDFFSDFYFENIILYNFYTKRENISALALNVELFYEGFLKSQASFEIILNSSNEVVSEKSHDFLGRKTFYLFEYFYMIFKNTINPQNESWLFDLYKENNYLPEEKKNNFLCEKEINENLEKFYMNFFNNYISEKESRKYFGNINKNLQEIILTILSKINFSFLYIIENFEEKKDEIKNILYDQIIFSRTQSIQKLCVMIYINLEPKLKKFNLLFVKLIETSNIIDRLYNLNDIRSDGNELVNPDERVLLMPILIRLYYSKYFYVSSKIKKVKTKNKINIVSFFIQLQPEEFKEYIKVIFKPLLIFQNFEKKNFLELNNEKNKKNLQNIFTDEILFCENPEKSKNFLENYINHFDDIENKYTLNTVKFLDLRIYRKILEILALNFKQINSLFDSSIDFLGVLIMNVLIFVKQSDKFFKTFSAHKKFSKKEENKNALKDEDDDEYDESPENLGMDVDDKNIHQEDLNKFLFSFEEKIKENLNISQSKYMNYWDKQKIQEFSNVYFKFNKQIKKNSFELLKKIFSKFSYKKDLINLISDKLFVEYIEIFESLKLAENLKVNSVMQFTFNIAKNPNMHSVFITNKDIFVSICGILSNKRIDNKFLNTLLEFCEDIISPYSKYKSSMLRYSENTGFKKIEIEEGNLSDESDEINKSERKSSSISSNSEDQNISNDKDSKNVVENITFKNKISEKNELFKLTHLNFIENENKLIKQNFKLLNDNLLILLTSGRLKLKIKESSTQRSIYLLLELWNLFNFEDEFFIIYTRNNQSTINNLIKFLLDFISKDSKIFKDEYKDYLSNILRLCNILVFISENKNEYYLDFLHLIYKISDTASRLILSVVLKQIQNPLIELQNKDLDETKKFNYISELLIKLNITKKTKSLEYKDNLDTDQVLENLNLINEEFCGEFTIFQLEPVIYQLITLANFCDDFSVQTLTISKIKMIFDYVLVKFYETIELIDKSSEFLEYSEENNTTKLSIYIEIESFENILKVLLNLLNFVSFKGRNFKGDKNSGNNNHNKSFTAENYISMNKIKQEKIKKNILELFSYINKKFSEIKIFEEKEKNILEEKNSFEISTLISINFQIFKEKNPIISLEFYKEKISLLLCRDLYQIKTLEEDESFQYDFFEGIMNLKYEIRSEILNQLNLFVKAKKIKYFSLINIIIPILKSFLNFDIDNTNNNSKSFDVFHKGKDINSIIDSSIDLIDPICAMLKKEDFISLLMHFYRRINKANYQDSSRIFEDNKYSFEKLYEILSKLLLCLNLFDFEFISEFDFDVEFNKTMRELIMDYKARADLNLFKTQNGKNNFNKNENNLNKLDDLKINKLTNDKFYSKDLFTLSFNKLSEMFYRSLNNPRNPRELQGGVPNDYNTNVKNAKFSDFSSNLTNQIFNMLKNMLIDNFRKDKTKKYYVRNFVIKPFFLILKKMDPRTLKYELLGLVYELMNNLKNKDLDVREKSRQGIRILLEILGPFISNVLFDQLKSQLTTGYQRYIMGYTCHYIISILNKLFLNLKEIEEYSKNLYLENQKNKFLNVDNIISLQNKNNFEISENEKNKISLSHLDEECEENKALSSDKIIEELKNNSANFDHVFLSRYGKFTKKDIELVYDFSIGIVVPILLDELFGEVSEEKEIDLLVKKYKEGKEVKAYNTFSIIASRIDFKTGILNLIFPIRFFLLDKENNNSTINKVNEVINYIIKGLKENNTMKIDDIILISFSLINIGLEINIKNSKEIKQNKKITIKGGDLTDTVKIKNDYLTQKNELVSLQLGTNSKKNYCIEIAKKFILEKNDIILSNLFTQFGLDIFFIAVKKNIFDFSAIKTKINKPTGNPEDIIDEVGKGMNSNLQDENEDLYQMELFNEFKNKKKNNSQNTPTIYTEEEFKEIINQLEILIFSIVQCLKISSNNILGKSLKILTKLFDTRLFVIKKNLKKIGSNLFKNLGILNLSDSDKTIAQTILSCLTEILNKFSFYEISDYQMKLLINFLKIYINKLEIKSYIFSCLFAIIKRKFLHPCIYDMIEYIQETFLISFDEATKSLCENIIIEFLNNYPLEDIRKQKHVNFYIVNLESNTRNCVVNSLRMLRKFIDCCNISKNKDLKSKNKNDVLRNMDEDNKVAGIVKDYIDFMVLKLLYLIGNSSDYEIKTVSSGILQEIFDSDLVNREKYDLYLNKIIDWIGIEEKITGKLNKKDKNYNASSDQESEEDFEEDDIYLDEKEKTYLKLGLNFLSILSSKQNETLTVKSSELLDILIKDLKVEFIKFEKEIDRKIQSRDYNNITEDSNNNFSKKKEFEKIFEKKEPEENEHEQDQNTNIISTLNLEEEEKTILNIQIENWDIYYLILNTLEKFSNIYPNLFKKKILSDKFFAEIIFKSIKHPHIFIKTISLRFINKVFSLNSQILDYENIEEVNLFLGNLMKNNKNKNIFDSEDYRNINVTDDNFSKINLNSLQVIFDNLKFIILNKDIEFKNNFVELAIDISSFITYLLLKVYNINSENNYMSNIDFSFYAYEFICRLYGDSKKYLANKNYSNIIIRRILIIIEKIFDFSKNSGINFGFKKDKIKNSKKIAEKKQQNFSHNNFSCKEMEIILEPILSLLYRLNSNNLVEDEIKSFSERVKIKNFKF